MAERLFLSGRFNPGIVFPSSRSSDGQPSKSVRKLSESLLEDRDTASRAPGQV